MRRNVALLVLDSVRKDFFDVYARRLRGMAGVSVEGARAPSSWSTPSHASMFVGDLPSEHGVHTYHRSFDETPAEAVFHTGLPHESVGVSANVYAGPAYGFDDYFDAFVDVQPNRRYPAGATPAEFDSAGAFVRRALRGPNRTASVLNGLTGVLHERWRDLPGPKLVDDTGAAVARVAASRLDDASEPWLLFANFMDAHIPLQHFRGLNGSLHGVDPSWSSDEYDVWELMEGDHPDYWNTRERVYAAYVDYLDRVVADFVETVREATDRPTTVVVTADHGENHGEASADGMANHKSSLSEQLLHVPLEVIDPPEAAAPVEGRCSLLDLPALLTAVARDEWAEIGRDVVPAELLGMSAGPEPPADFDRDYYERGIRAAYRGDVKVVWDSLGGAREYAVGSTPSDQTLVADDVDVPEWATDAFPTDLDRAVADARSNSATDDEVSDAVAARLDELGYV